MKSVHAIVNVCNLVSCFYCPQIRDGSIVSMDAPIDITLTKGRSSIPSPLEPWKHKILLVGKYINVLRECGVEVRSKCLSPVSCSSLDDQ